MWATLITHSDLKTQLLPHNRDPWSSRDSVMKAKETIFCDSATGLHCACNCTSHIKVPFTLSSIAFLFPNSCRNFKSLFFSYLSPIRHKGNSSQGKCSSGLKLCVCVCVPVDATLQGLPLLTHSISPKEIHSIKKGYTHPMEHVLALSLHYSPTVTSHPLSFLGGFKDE